MKKIAVKITAVFFVLVFAFSNVVNITAFAANDSEESTPVLILSAEKVTIAMYEKTQIVAKVAGVETLPEIIWTSSDSSIAAVNKEGVVYGTGKGTATIYAMVTVDGVDLRGEFDITVTASKNFLRDLLEDQQVLSYQYSYEDDYYYTNDKEAWQYNFGFGKIYDFVSPYILLEYDYVRVFFVYEDKDWMLQMWKGQYGLIFYGGEVGIYNRPHSEEGVHEWTMYSCPAEEDWLGMEITLWHEQLDGTWTREFSRDYDKYWWCTGFKNGHLRQEEPADELRLTGRITLKDAEMTELVSKGLIECGFGKSDSKENLGIDKIYVEGNDIHFNWQNISAAESTMAIKVIGGAMTAWTLITLLPLIAPYVALFWGAFGVLAMLVSVIL